MIRSRLALRFLQALAVALSLTATTGAAMAQKKPADASLLPGASSQEPLSIDADKLVYDDKAQAATYSGNVVVVQGTSKLTCSSLTVQFEKEAAAGATEAKAADSDAPPAMGSASVKRLEAAGPVTVVSKTQVATGDSALYDRVQKKVWLIGHVTLSDGGNVTKGDKLTYDLATGRANVEGGRVHGLFIPGSAENGGADSGKPKN